MKQGLNIGILTSSYPTKENPTAGPIVPVLARIFRRKGLGVFIYTQHREGHLKTIPGVRIETYGRVRTKKALALFNMFNPLDFFRAFRIVFSGRKEILSFCRRNRIDHCFCLWAVPSGYYGRYALKKLGVPYTVLSLGSDIHTMARNPVMNRIIRTILRDAEMLFGDGFNLVREMKRISKKQCGYFPTTTIGKQWRPVKKYPFSGPVDFLFAGRLEKVKGVDILLEAIRLAVPRIKRPVRFTLVGDGGLRGYCGGFINKNGLSGIIRMTGQKPLTEVFQYMSRSFCLVIPSRKESIPVVFSEALFWGLRLIAADAAMSDMAALVKKHRVGLVFPAGSAQALAECLIRAAENRMPYSGQGRGELRLLFNPERAADMFIKKVCKG